MTHKMEPLTDSHLPKQAIDEFKLAWKASFNEEISDEKASMEASSLLNLYSSLIEQRGL